MSAKKKRTLVTLQTCKYLRGKANLRDEGDSSEKTVPAVP